MPRAPDDLPADLWPVDGSLPCVRWAGDGRCDSAEVGLNSTCTVDPQPATLSLDEPSDDLTVAPEEEFDLAAHSTPPPEGLFAFRWTVYAQDDVLQKWPVTTLGYDDSGDGFSTLNENVTVTAAGHGLPMGSYQLVVEGRYPADGCDTIGWFLSATRTGRTSPSATPSTAWRRAGWSRAGPSGSTRAPGPRAPTATSSSTTTSAMRSIP